jgi:hypothetical protein
MPWQADDEQINALLIKSDIAVLIILIVVLAIFVILTNLSS